MYVSYSQWMNLDSVIVVVPAKASSSTLHGILNIPSPPPTCLITIIAIAGFVLLLLLLLQSSCIDDEDE